MAQTGIDSTYNINSGSSKSVYISIFMIYSKNNKSHIGFFMQLYIAIISGTCTCPAFVLHFTTLFCIQHIFNPAIPTRTVKRVSRHRLFIVEIKPAVCLGDQKALLNNSSEKLIFKTSSNTKIQYSLGLRGCCGKSKFA